jgi:hypothetical protein
MNQTNKSPKEAQNKVAYFLKEEFDRLKADHQKTLKKEI